MSKFFLKPFFFAFLTLALFAAAKSIGDDARSNQEVQNQKADLKSYAMKLIEDPKEIPKLRPTYGECLQMARDQKNAIRLWDYAVDFYDFVKSDDGLPVEERPDDLIVEMVAKDHSGLGGCKENLAEEFQSHSVWYRVTFMKGKKQVGTFLGFARVNDRWILIPRFYQAFTIEKTPPIYATALKMLSNDMHGDLYDLCSPRITEQIKRDDAAEFFAQLGVSKIKKLDVKTRGSKRVHDFSQFHYGMNVEFEDGRSAAINMIFDRTEDRGIALSWIALQSRLGVDAPSLFAPLPNQCRKLAKDLFGEILSALETENFEKLHVASSKQIRDKMTAEQLKAAFPPKNEVLTNLPLMDPENVTLRSPPSLGRQDSFTAKKLTFRPENERIPSGPLIVNARFSSEDSKQIVLANFEFNFEDSKWKPSKYTFQLPTKSEEK